MQCTPSPARAGNGVGLQADELLQPDATLAEVAALVHRTATLSSRQQQRLVRLRLGAITRATESGPHVVVLALETVQPADLVGSEKMLLPGLGQLPEVGEVAAADLKDAAELPKSLRPYSRMVSSMPNRVSRFVSPTAGRGSGLPGQRSPST